MLDLLQKRGVLKMAPLLIFNSSSLLYVKRHYGALEIQEPVAVTLFTFLGFKTKENILQAIDLKERQIFRLRPR